LISVEELAEISIHYVLLVGIYNNYVAIFSTAYSSIIRTQVMAYFIAHWEFKCLISWTNWNRKILILWVLLDH